MRKTYQRLLLLIIIAAALGAAFWAGLTWNNAHQPVVEKAGNVDLTSFWKAWGIINDRFVDTTSTSTNKKLVTDQDKVYGAAEGLVRALGDPYSEFLLPPDKKQFDEDIKGQFGGVGIEIGVRGGALVVIAPVKGTPAAMAGIRAGDKIIEIAGRNTGELTLGEAIDLIRGEVGTFVIIKTERAGNKTPLEFKLKRAVINVPTVETKQLDSGIFVIKLENFGGTSANLFRKALRDFVTFGQGKLILDLRGNPGGYLEAAVDIASWFLPVGQVVAIEDRGGNSEPQYYRSYGYNIFTNQLKMAILVDGGSASAAEILAGALREHGRATLIGEQTFGKGSVQEVIPITSDASLKLTVAKWLTPNGLSISHNGLKPDLVVKVPDNKIDTDKLDSNDLVLQRAVDFLNK